MQIGFRVEEVAQETLVHPSAVSSFLSFHWFLLRSDLLFFLLSGKRGDRENKDLRKSIMNFNEQSY